ncbi:hypothetical protein EDB83DRAFT_2524063 [Lactarius deliciosus]|nr:hypothetical protein EDB83DRAFT_2524063 [Lactarius deliciosus]
MSSILHVTTTSRSSPSSDFQSIFSTALKAYEKQTKRDLFTHPLASQLQACDSPDSILSVLQSQVDSLDQARKSDEKLTRWLSPTVNVLLAFSATLGEGVFSPAKVIFAGAGVLLQAVKDVSAAQDALIDIFERIENFFKRLETYTSIRATAAMTDIIVKIMVEVLNILAIATKEIKQGRTKKYLKKLVGKTDIEDALRRLDRLTQEEVRMATAQLLKITHGVDYKVTKIDDEVKGVDDKVKDVGDSVKLVLDDGKETKVIAQQTAREATAIMQFMANNVDEVKMSQWRQDFRKWLSSPDPSTNHIIFCAAQHQGTARWFFRSSFLAEWKSAGSLLWIHGKPGSGKSVLCSAIIQNVMTLRDAGLASMAYFYFDFRDTDKQNCRNLLLSLLSQLSTRSDLCCDILHRAYVTHDNGSHKPTDDVLIQCLKETLMFSDNRPIYIILDALDECPVTFGVPSPRELVLDLVKDLVELPLPHLHICVTSRPEIDIRTALEPLTSLRVSLHDQTGQREDIVEYVSSVVHLDPRMGKWREQDRNLVIETLSDKADGMFRWVFCQLETVRQCFPPSLGRILRELPESLDETYERILKNIGKATRDHAHRLLQCLTVAVRPLRLEELAEVLAFDFDEASGGIPKLNGDWRREDQEQAVLSTCSSLITVVHDGESPVVQFSHFSVKEFLTSDRLAMAVADVSFHHILLEPAHTIISQACLGVLLRLDDTTRETSVQRFPLVQYAAEHWVDHALFENVAQRINDGVEDLFDPDKAHFRRWIRIYDTDNHNHWGLADGEMRPELLEAAPVYYAALCGFPDVVVKLISEYPEHRNARGGACGTALHAAARRNHVEVVKSLLEHGVDVNSLGQWERTTLHIASVWEHLEIVRSLLEHGADVNAKQDDHWTPLHMVARNGNFELVRMFLQHNADINARNDIGHTPLHAASNNGHVDIARFLLDHGADPKARGKDQSTPLHWASYWGELEVAHLLLERGADVDAEDGKGRTAYQIALKEGHDEIAQLLGHGIENKT